MCIWVKNRRGDVFGCHSLGEGGGSKEGGGGERILCVSKRKDWQKKTKKNSRGGGGQFFQPLGGDEISGPGVGGWVVR